VPMTRADFGLHDPSVMEMVSWTLLPGYLLQARRMDAYSRKMDIEKSARAKRRLAEGDVGENYVPGSHDEDEEEEDEDQEDDDNKEEVEKGEGSDNGDYDGDTEVSE